MKGFTQELIMKQKNKMTQKWRILVHSINSALTNNLARWYLASC